MGSTNNGKQILTFDYAQEGTAQGFNKIMHKLIPSGIISGGNLIKVTDGTVAISTFLSFFEDTNNGLGLRLETTDTANVLVTETNNWIVGRFNWLNIEENYMDFLGVAWDNIQSTDIIFGKCIFNALGELTSFDTSRKSWSRSYYENFKSKYPNFCVLPNVPENDKVLVCKGKGYINGKKVELTSESTQSISFDLNVSNSRIDLVVINENSEIEVIKGEDSGDAKVPKCPINKLILAKVNLPSNPTSISGTFIENIYSVNPYTNSELVDYSITKEKFKQTTINYLTPVGIILPYGGEIAPDGYLLCDGREVSRTEYSALFNVIGTSFGNGDTINTFNVPDLRGRFLEGANKNLGKRIEAGLPNIQGSMGFYTGQNISFDGCFKETYSETTGIYGSPNMIKYKSVYFDASSSNTIYGKSSTVQPPAVCVNYIIRY